MKVKKKYVSLRHDRSENVLHISAAISSKMDDNALECCNHEVNYRLNQIVGDRVWYNSPLVDIWMRFTRPMIEVCKTSVYEMS